MLTIKEASSTYTNTVGDVKIRYTARQQSDSCVEVVSARLTKNEEYAGSADMAADGNLGISLVKGFTAAERKSILIAIADDLEEIFTPKSSNEA